ncbi:hypothetical protein [Streptococcus thoraltensis]|uniref:aldose epimerase family protein n=1 Tax=Streptococcus thoraltensis TaxID=55085 RepID=UPI001F574283|nr:hypothetical protein [Streptococcus thoraltensis]
MKEYILENDKICIKFLDYGGIITAIIKKSNNINYVLSYEDFTNYERNPYYFGATIGRTAGRTFPPNYKNSKGDVINLDINEGLLNLHGGNEGLHKQYWDVSLINKDTYELTYNDTDSHYEEMLLKIRYRIEDNSFILEYFGFSDEPTVCNLTNHTYFNLNKDKRDGIEEHWLQMTPTKLQIINDTSVPTEEYSDMSSKYYSSFDFTEKRKIGDAFRISNELSKICADGIDLAYIFDTDLPEIVLQSFDKENVLRITTDRECAVIYTLNKINERLKIKDGGIITKYNGITFETQERPNHLQTKSHPLISHYHARTKYTIE